MPVNKTYKNIMKSLIIYFVVLFSTGAFVTVKGDGQANLIHEVASNTTSISSSVGTELSRAGTRFVVIGYTYNTRVER